MNVPHWHEEAIRKDHERDRFDCGDLALDEFLGRHARKSHEQGSSKTYLAIDAADGRTIRGFYSISPACIAFARTPDVIKSGLARHDVPAFRLGRLAVHRDMQGKGLGREMLVAAASRCFRIAEQSGGIGLLIDAKSERIAKWYASFGALPIIDAPLSLFLPFKAISASIKAAQF